MSDNPTIDGGRGESIHLTPVQQNKIISLMLHADRAIWPIKRRHKREAVDVTAKNMKHEDGRVSNGAVRNLLAMEGQNMKQAEADRQAASGNAGQVTNNIIQVQVIQPNGTQGTGGSGGRSVEIPLPPRPVEGVGE